MEKETHIIPPISIKRIKDISFSIHEERAIPNRTSGIKIEMNHIIGYDIKQDILSLILRIFVHYEDRPAEEILSEIQVQNLFEIKGINQYIKEGNLILPFEILFPILSVSISHSRALFFTSLAGTFLQEVILPFTDVIDVLRHFFPDLHLPDNTKGKK
jgi:preprotein translocase subunit SecB